MSIQALQTPVDARFLGHGFDKDRLSIRVDVPDLGEMCLDISSDVMDLFYRGRYGTPKGTLLSITELNVDTGSRPLITGIRASSQEKFRFAATGIVDIRTKEPIITVRGRVMDGHPLAGNARLILRSEEKMQAARAAFQSAAKGAEPAENLAEWIIDMPAVKQSTPGIFTEVLVADR